jgi:uncharacterized membrane protein YeaQ/YmgE (transglycosylase-associated protein family)
MSVFVWVMMGIALWHFTVFVPDRFWGGIVGAFCAATVGAFVFGFAVAGFKIVGRHELELTQAVEAIPGAVIALVASWYYGRYVEEHGPRRRRRRAARASS